MLWPTTFSVYLTNLYFIIINKHIEIILQRIPTMFKWGGAGVREGWGGGGRCKSWLFVLSQQHGFHCYDARPTICIAARLSEPPCLRTRHRWCHDSRLDAILELATKFWFLVLSILHNYAKRIIKQASLSHWVAEYNL